jgi:hypothetical protein
LVYRFGHSPLRGLVTRGVLRDELVR